MNTQELRNKIHELEAELKSFKAELDKELSKPKMFPQEGEKYWFYSPQGDVYNNNALDNNVKLNVYKTREEAERARDIELAKQRVKFAIEVANNGWTPDWTSVEQSKYCFSFLHNSNKILIYCYSTEKLQSNNMYIKSKEIAEKISAEYKADLELIFSE